MGHLMHRGSLLGRGQLKCDDTSAETRFRLSAKRSGPLKSAGASVQSTIGSRGVRISGSNAGYTVFRGSVKGTGYPLHSPVSPSLPLPCVTVCHHISNGVYKMDFICMAVGTRVMALRIWARCGSSVVANAVDEGILKLGQRSVNTYRKEGYKINTTPKLFGNCKIRKATSSFVCLSACPSALTEQIIAPTVVRFPLILVLEILVNIRGEKIQFY